MATDDEVFVIDQVNNWQSAMDQAVRLAKCLNKQPALILTGETSAKMVDLIDKKTWEKAHISVRFIQYCTISDISDVFMTSEEQAKTVAKTIAERHGLENERSWKIFKYIDEIWELIRQDTIFGKLVYNN
ncbi:MAG: hypothetical protein ACYCV0_19655 [Desulfitobacteriaceae bacterium]